MITVFRLLMTAVVGFFVLAGAEFLKANAAADLPPDPIPGDEMETGGYDDAPENRTPELIAGGELGAGVDFSASKSSALEHGAKLALGSNANAVLALDLIADGGTGNERDDGVTTGAVSGRGTKIAIEVFATGVRTSLIGINFEFAFDPSLVAFVKVENNAFSQLGQSALAAIRGATLAPSGFLARAEFETVADVTGREFSIGIEKVTIAQLGASPDELTTARVISFNATPSADFDGDGTVGFSDFLTFAGAFGSRQGDGKYNAAQDLNSDGAVDFTDFLIFAGDFGSQVPPSGGGGTPSGGGETVTIADANLREVIADSLGKARNAPITRDEMATLTHIDASNKGVRDLTGLEHATNLTTLDLGRARVDGEWVNSNEISDLSPLSRLTNLTNLDLTSNRISSISALSNLTNLTQLHLGGNQTISDVSALSNLTMLTRLNLWDNDIKNISALSDVTGLTYLSISRNHITNISAVSNLTNLEVLYLWGNSISSISALSRLTNLAELYIGSIGLSDISSLSRLTNLRRLFLDRNRISSISALSNLTELTTLNLSANSISSISALSNLTNLTWLDLGRAKVDGEWVNSNDISDLSPLATLTNLTWLNLGANSISSLSALSNLTNLTTLALHLNSISDVSALSTLTNLTWLNLGANSISKISALSTLTSLTELHLYSNSISEISALSTLTNLEVLGLFDNSISDISALSDLTNLTLLRLDDNNIPDISPLVANTGLGDGDTVHLQRNPLSNASRNTHIPTLQRRGVTVEFNGGTTPPPSDNPDLIVESPSVDDNTLTTGQSFRLSATVSNQGNASAAATTLRYYRSSNATISTDDTEVGTDAVSTLSAGATSAESISLNAPADAGTYHYGACVDDVSGESNTDNNCSSGVEVTVSGGGDEGRACTAGLVVKPGESCNYKNGTFYVNSSGLGIIISGGVVMTAGNQHNQRGIVNGIRWNFHASKNSNSNSWTIHTAN